MPKIDKYQYEIIMKVLEIVHTSEQENANLENEQNPQKAKMLRSIKENPLFQQVLNGDLTLVVGDVGDHFENINHSVIATGSANTTGLNERLGQAFQQANTMVDSRNDVPAELKGEIKNNLKTLEEELKKDEPNAGNVQRLRGWFKQNASWVVPTIAQIVTEIMNKAFT